MKSILLHLLEPDFIPHTTYIIFATPRSGSTFLCDALSTTGLAGRPKEHFLPWYRAENEPERLLPSEVSDWLQPSEICLKNIIVRGYGNGTFGAKIMPLQLEFAIGKLRHLTNSSALSDAEVLNAVFPNLSAIHMRREDKILQAISLARAVQSGKWHLRIDPNSGKERPPGERARRQVNRYEGVPLAYNFDQIRSSYKTVVHGDVKMSEFVSKLSCPRITVTYESLIESPAKGIAAILDFLRVDHPLPFVMPPTKLQKMGDNLNEEWAIRFMEDLKNISSNR